jgi:ADP-ribosyl-[dinitrogen reductase] hydrolase
MFGALIGDCIGSFWEFSRNKDPAIPLWIPACKFTDDSVCTGAIATWLLEDDQTSEAGLTPILHALGRQHIARGFADRMRAWIESDVPVPYGSWGNGSAMRVSPVALWAQNDEEADLLAARSANVTHNSPQAVQGAQATVWAIRHAFTHRDPERLLQEFATRFNLPALKTIDLEAARRVHVFDVSCQGTVPLALAIACKQGSFRAAMNLCCSMGGDADTLAAIAGPIAEALHGIPEVDLNEARRRFRPTDGLWEPVKAMYAHPRVQANLKAWGREEGTGLAGFESTLPKGSVSSRLR